MPGRQKIDTHRSSREDQRDMPGRHGIEIKIVRESGEVLGTVPNTQAPRWEVVQTAAPGDAQRPVAWEAAIKLPQETEPLLLFFESREFAKRWVEEDRRARGYDWSQLDRPACATRVAAARDLTRRYVALAEEHRVGRDSKRAFDLAHEKGLLTSSLVVYDGYGNSNSQNEPFCVPPGDGTPLPWQPMSCESNGTSSLYYEDETLTIAGAGQSVPSLPLGALYARTS
jgi:hypothetical protein